MLYLSIGTPFALGFNQKNTERFCSSTNTFIILLKMEETAQKRSLSPNYICEYFKRQTNSSLREYIMKAKLRQVEIRLLNSDYTFDRIRIQRYQPSFENI